MVWFAWREFCLVGSVSTDLTIDDVDKVSCAKKEKNAQYCREGACVFLFANVIMVYKVKEKCFT